MASLENMTSQPLHDAVPGQRHDLLLSLCAALPLIALLLFYSLVLMVRVTLGYWPTRNRPDPKQLGLDLYCYSLMLLLVVAYLSPLAVASVLALRLAFLRYRPRKLTALPIFAIAYVLLLALRSADPGGFFLWFFD